MTQQRSTFGESQSGTEAAKDRLRDMADAAGETVKDAAKLTEDAAKLTDELARLWEAQARQLAQKAQEAAKQVRPFLEKSMKEQPLATLAGAAVLAFALGALWRK